MTSKRQKPVRKRKDVPQINQRHSAPPKRSGTVVLGRVKPDYCAVVWGLSVGEIRDAAASISKDIEARYQVDLLEQSGFGQPGEGF